MSDQHAYLIKLRGAVKVAELNTCAPLQISEVQTDAQATLLVACTDQAGLIGLLRHWHGLGLQFLSITFESNHQEN